MRGGLSLGVGTVFVPYLMAIPKKLREPAFRDCGAALTRGYELRQMLLEELGAPTTSVSQHIFHMDHYLIKPSQWRGDPVAQAAQSIVGIRPRLEAALERWRALESR